MANLAQIADGIMDQDSDYRDSTLESSDAVLCYAEAAGESITYAQAERIRSACKAYLAAVAAGDGGTNRYYYTVTGSLED